MNRTSKILIMAMALTVAATGAAMATPSTQIWIPSTDTQAYKTLHLGIDNYTRTSNGGSPNRPNVYDLGLTAGVLPFEKIQAEVGIDYISNGISGYDSNPISFNAKLATPEDALFTFSPALALGGYGIGTNSSSSSAFRTDQNIIYGLVARTLPVVGRLSAGYYVGNDEVLLDSNLKKENNGVLLSWDRTMTEISDKLWLAVDYQGGKNAVGAVSFGAAWNFSKNVSVILGYDIYNDTKVAGQNTFTTQVDINFP
jgi:opacity protein-like surface antigen